MTICHGQGDVEVDGCCWVDGAVCPLRLKIDGGVVYEGPDLVDQGTVDGYVKARVKGKPNQDRVIAQLQGVRFACRAAADVLAADGNLLNDRPAFEQAWNTQADYVAQVRPAWDRLEDARGLPRGSYQCSTWRGEGGAQCCFREDVVANEVKAGGLSVEARTLRQGGGL